MKNLYTISNKIDLAVEKVLKGFSSQYIEFTDDEDNNWTIRISDHKANPLRTDDNTISLVVLVPEKELNNDENHNNWGVAKKEFNDIRNQYFIDEKGSFEENFCTTLEMLEYYLD